MENRQIITEEKARELRDKYLGRDLAEMLTAPTPKDIIEERPARGGTMVKYVAGPNFITRLNDCFGFLWSYDVPHAFELNGQIVNKGQLTVHVPVPKKKTIKKYVEDGKIIEEESVEYERWDVIKTQWGSSEIKRYAKDVSGKGGKVIHKAGDVIDLGDDYKGAATDAMKKCATQFGIFLDVYAARGAEEEGVVTKAQIDVFYWRAEEAGMNKEEAEKWGEEQLGRPIREWDPLDAMGLIPVLIDKKKEKEEGK